MIFQTIDDKSECIGVYANGKLHFDNFPNELTRTWKFTGSLSGKQVEYAWLVANGRPLGEGCPEELSEEFQALQKKMAAYLKSFTIAKIDLNQHCIFDLVPHDFLTQFCDVKNKITAHVFESFTRPKNYDHLNEVYKLLYKIKYQRMNLSIENSRHLLHSSATRKKVQQLLKNHNYIDYNLFGTVTGRLTTCPESFPILTLKREIREMVRPVNNLFISLDYNGAEVRTLLELCGQEQPQEDIHAWNARHLFEQEITREECKVRFFAWLYDPASDDINTEYYNREKILDKWYKEGYIHTPYGREIHVEARKALNYLIQSTTADRVLSKAVIIDKLLDGRKSFISHIVHDEVVIDYHDEDRDLIPAIQNAFADGFLVNLKGGKDYYNLKELNI